jgi:pimeloyl-ACP methyl ester carboxylesterase
MLADLTGRAEIAGPDAPLLVLLHASVVTRKMWLPQRRSLSSCFCVAAPDLPGHGDIAGVAFSFAAATASVLEVIGALGRSRASSPVCRWAVTSQLSWRRVLPSWWPLPFRVQRQFSAVRSAPTSVSLPG